MSVVMIQALLFASAAPPPHMGGEALPHRRHSIFRWRLCLRLRRGKPAVVRTTCGSGWLISDSLTCSGLFQINRPLPQAVLTKLNRSPILPLWKDTYPGKGEANDETRLLANKP